MKRSSLKKKMDFNEKNLIIYFCEKVDKVGEQTAIAIAEFFDNSIKDFYDADKLNNFKNSKGTVKLKPNQIADIKEVIKIYVSNQNKYIKEIWIEVLLKDFVKNAIAELQNTSLETLLINPFMVKAFGFDDPKEVVTFYFYQKVTRSVVTSWGFTIEGLLLCSGAERTDLEGFDIKVPRDEINYQLQIKSSPNTMSVEQVRQLNTHIRNIKDKINNIPLLGMTYGRESQINSQIRGYLTNFENSIKIGKELWDFIAGESGYCQQMLDLIDEIMSEEPIKFSDELEKKKLLLFDEWKENFGDGKESIDKVLENYL